MSIISKKVIAQLRNKSKNNDQAREDYMNRIEGMGLKVIAVGNDWIDWKRTDGMKCRSYSYDWVGHSDYLRIQSGKMHNCMQHAKCEYCGRKL